MRTARSVSRPRPNPRPPRARRPASLAVPVLLAALAAALAAPPAARAVSKTASYSGEIEAGRWSGIRLSNLVSTATLDVALSTDGELGVLLLDESGYGALPAGFGAGAGAMFRGRTDDEIGFFVTVPESGDYYLVIDNRAGDRPRSYTLEVTASLDTDAAGLPAQAAARLEASLDRLTDALAQLFVFESLDIRAARCGRENLYSDADGIVICAEFAQRLMDQLGDRQKASDALAFAVFHELGHVLLRQWRYPAYDNEEVADEFATMLMRLLGADAKVRAQAEYFAAGDADAEVERKLATDDRHPLSVQRARNILRWLADPKLVRRWQPVLVPHMRTALLEQIADQPPGWADAELVAEELARRGR